LYITELIFTPLGGVGGDTGSGSGFKTTGSGVVGGGGDGGGDGALAHLQNEKITRKKKKQFLKLLLL
tara:strand:- start:469 stop:669 length:201 start_codon:yes stop_codon:yes gene_type:complete